MFPRCQGACYRSVDDWVCTLGFIFLHWGSSPTGWFSRSSYYVEILSWSTAKCFIQNTSIRSGPGDFQSQFYISFSCTSVIMISVKLFVGEFPRCATSSVYDSSDCSILITKIVRIILFFGTVSVFCFPASSPSGDVLNIFSTSTVTVNSYLVESYLSFYVSYPWLLCIR